MSLLPKLRRLVERIYLMANISPKYHYCKLLDESQYFPEKRLLQIQFARLKELIDYVYNNNSFYRTRLDSVGLKPDYMKQASDISILPILTKADIRYNISEMISSGFEIAHLQKAKTGGSTGKALELYFTEECSELRNACAQRSDRWTGWEPGEPIAACWGNPVLPKTFKQKLRQWLLQPMIYLDTMSVNEESIRAFVREWDTIKPTLLFGHAHSIFLLARYLQDMKIDHLRPKGIISSSMMLLPSERKVIEEVFQRKVFDRYGCEEVSLIGCECEKHEGMHLNIEHLYIEFLREDGTPCASGESGRIVVTDLMNKAMPLIRYQVEDMGVPTDKKCSCGRGLPMMESVTGRVADFLLKKNGTRVAGISLIENTLTKFSGLDQMQIIQHDYLSLELRVVPGNGYNDGVENDLRVYFQSVFGDAAIVEIERLPCIPPEKSGKYRFAICNIS